MMKEDILTRRHRIQRARWAKYMQDMSFYALIAEVFLLVLSPSMAEAAMLISAAALLMRRHFDNKFGFRALPLDIPAGLFVVIGAASILIAPDRFKSFYNFYHLVGAYVLTYVLAGQIIRTPSELKTLVAALGLSAVLVLLGGFWQFAFGIDTEDMKWVDGDAFPELKKRVFSSLENPNILAGYLDAMICLAFGFFVKCGSRAKRIVLSCFLFALIACLVMTYARGAMLVIGVILVLYGLFQDWRILLACLLIGAGALLLDPMLSERLLSVFTKVDTSTEMRVALWESTLQMIQDHPFLGIGWGAFYAVYPAYDFYLQGADVLIVHAHNMYLNYMAEIGLMGAGAFFWFFFGALYLAVRMRFSSSKETSKTELSPVKEESLEYRESPCENVLSSLPLLADFCQWEDARFLSGLRLGLILAFASVALNGLTDDLLFNLPTSMLLWLFVGLTCSMNFLKMPKAAAAGSIACQDIGGGAEVSGEESNKGKEYEEKETLGDDTPADAADAGDDGDGGE